MHPEVTIITLFLSCGGRVGGEAQVCDEERPSPPWAPSKFCNSFKLRRPLGIVRRWCQECNKPGFESVYRPCDSGQETPLRLSFPNCSGLKCPITTVYGVDEITWG